MFCIQKLFLPLPSNFFSRVIRLCWQWNRHARTHVCVRTRDKIYKYAYVIINIIISSNIVPISSCDEPTNKKQVVLRRLRESPLSSSLFLSLSHSVSLSLSLYLSVCLSLCLFTSTVCLFASFLSSLWSQITQKETIELFFFVTFSKTCTRIFALFITL